MEDVFFFLMNFVLWQFHTCVWCILVTLPLASAISFLSLSPPPLPPPSLRGTTFSFAFSLTLAICIAIRVWRESVVVACWRHWFPLAWTLLVGSSHSFSVPVPPRTSCRCSRAGSSWLCLGEKDTGRCASQGCVGTTGQQCDLTCQSTSDCLSWSNAL